MKSLLHACVDFHYMLFVLSLLFASASIPWCELIHVHVSSLCALAAFHALYCIFVYMHRLCSVMMSSCHHGGGLRTNIYRSLVYQASLPHWSSLPVRSAGGSHGHGACTYNCL